MYELNWSDIKFIFLMTSLTTGTLTVMQAYVFPRLCFHFISRDFSRLTTDKLWPTQIFTILYRLKKHIINLSRVRFNT